MKNLWPDFSNMKNVKSPKEVLLEQASLLPKLTGDMLYATVDDTNRVTKVLDGKNYDFVLDFNIRGKFLENYKYRIFSLYHNIMIYPFMLYLDYDIKRELNYPTGYIKINNEDEFYDILEKVLSSEVVRNVVSSIISLSK